VTASRDLQASAEAGPLDAHGDRRGRYYTASERPRKILAEIHTRKPAPEADPFGS
jgi:hypothetical protein